MGVPSRLAIRFTSTCLAALLCLTARRLQAETLPINGFQLLQGVVVRDIAQDSYGHMWLASDTGLWRWSNNGFQSLASRLSSVGYPRCFLVDDAGLIWVGTRQGVFGLNFHDLVIEESTRLLPDLTINCFFRDPAGQMWVCAMGGLFRLDRDQDTYRTTCQPGTRDIAVYSLTVGLDGKLLAGTNRGVLRIREDGVESLYSELTREGRVRAILQVPDGALWIGLRNKGALYRIEQGRVQRLGTAEGLACEEINSIIQGPDGDVWFGSEKGVFCWTGQSFRRIGWRQGLENDDVHCLFVDRDRQIWMGTFGGGAFRLRSRHVVVYGVEDGLRHPFVTSVVSYPDDTLLLGTISGALRFDPRTGLAQRLGPEPHEHVDTVYIDRSGVEWLGGPRGFGTAQDTAFRSPPTQVNVFGEDRAGNLLIGSGSGLWAVHGTGAEHVALPSRPGCAVNDIALARDGNVYAATDDGLYQDLDGQWTPVAPRRTVLALCETPNGDLWLATPKGFLVRKDGRIEEAPVAAREIGGVRDIACDSSGAFWAATQDGVVRIRGTTVSFFSYPAGLPSRDVRSIAVLSSTYVFAGTTRGLARLDVSRLQPCRTPPRIRAEFVARGNTWSVPRSGLEIPYAVNTVTLKVQRLGWQSAEGLLFQYRLDGRDAAWLAPTEAPSHVIEGLRPGRYTARVRAVNRHGLQSDEVAVHFAVLPPFWQETWFVSLVLFTGAAGLFLVARIRGRRRSLQRELRENEEKFRTLAETVAAATFIFHGPRMLYANRAAEAISGYTRDELLAMPFWAVIHPEFRNLVRDRGLARQQGGDVPTRYEVKILTKSGEVRWVDFTAGLIEYCRESAVLGTAFDITERKEAETALRRSEQRYRAVVEDQTEYICRLAPDGTHTFLNDAYCRCFGKSREELIGSNFMRLIPDEAHEAVKRHFAALCREAPVKSTEHRVITAEGQPRWHLWTNRAIFDGAGNIVEYQSVGHDITERKKAEAERSRLEAQLHQSQRLEAVGTLASGIAHDFNNLLTAIFGYTELAKSSLPAAHPAVESLEMVDQASSQARGVVNALLTFSRKKPTKKKPVNLVASLAQTVRLLRRILPASIEMIEELPEEDTWVLADETQLQQVWMNVVVNARDAMPSGGRLRIALRPAGIEGPVDDSASGDGGAAFAMIVVEDSGVGMSDNVRSRLFEPFFSTKPRGQGTGLGLSVTHAIIADHGGRIDVESQPRRGARVLIRLPRCPPPDEPAVGPGARCPAVGQNALVLVVEDNDLVRSIITSSLRSQGCKVVAASDGREAMDFLKSLQDRLRLVVIDLDLPGASGIDIVRKLRETRPDVPGVIITGKPDFDGLEGMVENDRILLKPFHTRDLEIMVARLLDEAPIGG